MDVPPPKVIVVDDEPVVRQFMQVALTDMGCEVETLGTCSEGLARTKQADFDVFFVDKNLSDGTGLRICEQLSGADCKVALITGYANLNSAVEAMRHGVAEYFIKPIDLGDLEARFARMMTQLRLERNNRALLEQLVQKCEELERLAARDTVTGLYNYSHFRRQLGAEVERCRNKHQFALALIALDRFSVVNERVGHERGDQVLGRVARLLVTGVGGITSRHGAPFLREVALPTPGVLGEQDLACRLEGDTFAVILPETSAAAAAAKLERFRVRLSEEQLYDDLPLLTASVGIALYPSDAENQRALLDAAQLTLTKAKALGGDCILFHEHDTKGEEGLRAELQRVRALGGCLANQAVRFVYQPIVSIRNNLPFAYEALCRPTAREFENIGELLGVAGRTGRLAELGQVLREVALRPLDRLPPECSLFLNVHPQELEGDALFAANSALHGNARRIVLEITETEQIGDFKLARERLRALRALGFRIALDDFGAGYQGFSCLAMLEPDFIKLDMDIVRDITPASRAGRLTRHIREFCDGEGIATIAEGVETLAEFQALRELGVDLMQGHLFALPSEPFCDIAWPEAPLRAG